MRKTEGSDRELNKIRGLNAVEDDYWSETPVSLNTGWTTPVWRGLKVTNDKLPNNTAHTEVLQRNKQKRLTRS